MKIDFHKKVVVITGGTSGIGQACVQVFEEAEAKVIILDLSPPPETEGSSFKECDITNGSKVQEVFHEITKEHGEIDVLINNAGIQTYGNAVDTTEKTWDKTLDTNLKGAFLCSKYAIPSMLKSTRPIIINVSSAQAFATQENVTAYAVSKEALHALTRSIAIDFAPKLRCVAVAPGAVNTPMLQDNIDTYEDKKAVLKETEDIHLLKRIASSKEIASFILLLASDLASFATGHVYRVDGGIGLKIEGT